MKDYWCYRQLNQEQRDAIDFLVQGFDPCGEPIGSENHLKLACAKLLAEIRANTPQFADIVKAQIIEPLLGSAKPIQKKPGDREPEMLDIWL